MIDDDEVPLPLVSTEPKGKLGPQPWATSAETKAVIAALTAAGADVRFVGGCVRDALAHRPVIDIDIATPDRPERVLELLAAAGIRSIPTGIEHGTVTALIRGTKYEITTLRRDVETDGRRARVAFTSDWIEDAKRRDFTINAMSCSPEGDIYDPFGGLEDLGHGRILFVGRAKDRIEEDLLRMLRYFRFYGSHGRPPPDIEALNACRDLAPRLSELSGERVQSEFFKILLDKTPAEIVGLMRGERILDGMLPGIRADNLGRLRLVSWLETNAAKLPGVEADPLRRLAALLTTDAAGAKQVADRLRLSNVHRDRLVRMMAPPTAISIKLDEHAQRLILYELGDVTVRDLAILAWAGELAIAPRQPTAKATAWQALVTRASTWSRPTLPLTGHDVQALGIAPGPEIGTLLTAVEAWWKEGDFRAGREECLERLRVVFQDG